MKILIIGSTGWIGRNVNMFAQKAGLEVTAINRSEFWVGDSLKHASEAVDAIVNCAGFVGSPNVDACEDPSNRGRVMQGNAGIPMRIKEMCGSTPVLHVSSGCIYQGRKPDMQLREAIDYVEKEINIKEFQSESWSEEDEPNFTGSVYARSKILGEDELLDRDNTWIFRPRMFFCRGASNRNVITKLLLYPRLVNAINSVTHAGQFCTMVIKCIIDRVPYGIYNMTHAKPVATSMIMDALGTQKDYVTCQAFNAEMRDSGLAERSFTTLDSTKSIANGIGLDADPWNLIMEYAHENK